MKACISRAILALCHTHGQLLGAWGGVGGSDGGGGGGENIKWNMIGNVAGCLISGC